MPENPARRAVRPSLGRNKHAAASRRAPRCCVIRAPLQPREGLTAGQKNRHFRQNGVNLLYISNLAKTPKFRIFPATGKIFQKVPLILRLHVAFFLISAIGGG